VKTIVSLFIVPFLLSSLPAWSCESGTDTVYISAYATRSGAIAITYVDASIGGADSEYSYATITQYDYLNGSEYGSAFSLRSASAGASVSTERTRNINLTAFGTYSVQGYVQLYDSCDGVSFPPYNSGSPWTNVSILSVPQPQVVTNAAIYTSNFTGSNPGGTVPEYPNSTSLEVSILGGYTGTTVWTLTGNTGAVNMSCTSCSSPVVTAQANATPSCSVALTASFVIDGLQSNNGSIMILGPKQISANDPNTGLHADHKAVSGGYNSVWCYQIVDTCGNPMGYVTQHEAFPSGFTYDYAGSHWGFPTANSWSAGNTGLWEDSIGQSGATNPTSINPKTPTLGTVLVYHGNQQIYVDPVVVTTDSQAHYQDHGGYN
jgi:hypothetical protein